MEVRGGDACEKRVSGNRDEVEGNMKGRRQVRRRNERWMIAGGGRRRKKKRRKEGERGGKGEGMGGDKEREEESTYAEINSK